MSKPYKLAWRKRALSSPAVQNMVALLAAGLLKLCWLTLRRSITQHPDAVPYYSGERQAIFCLWHGRMILFPFLKPASRKLHVLISHHRDGALIAKLISHFGVSSVRGSSSKGAKEATKTLLTVLEKGDNVAITPDGPRGPAHQASRGALHMARLSGCPMVPVSFSASSFTQLKSWDGFIIPHPFARIQVEIGKPVYIANNAKLKDMSEFKKMLEDGLNAASERADEVQAA